MTTSEALNKIPEIVAMAIPLTPPDYSCAEKKAIWTRNAEWRREQLTTRMREMVIRLQDYRTSSVTGMAVDLLEPLGRYLAVALETNDLDEAVKFCKELNYDNVFVLDRIGTDVIVPEK